MMSKMPSQGAGPVRRGRKEVRQFKREQAKRDAASGPGVPIGMGIQNRGAAKLFKKNVKAGNKARRKNSRSLQRRLVKVK
jgi:hypothetical protein